ARACGTAPVRRVGRSDRGRVARVRRVRLPAARAGVAAAARVDRPRRAPRGDGVRAPGRARRSCPRRVVRRCRRRERLQPRRARQGRAGRAAAHDRLARPRPDPRDRPTGLQPRARRRARANATGGRHGLARRRVPLLLPRARRAVVSERLRVPPPLPRVRAHDRRGNAALHARLPARLARSVVLGGLQAAPSDTVDRRLERVRRLPGGELMRVGVLTTSYPRHPGDTAGRFVADAVEHVRRRGVDVEVVGPEQFRGFGLTYGHGVVGNLRRRPWLALFVPAMLASFVGAARRVDADLLHAHWLPSGWVAAHTGKPYVVQVWGTDVELARRAPRLARGVLRRARLVIAASTALADSARELGAAEVRVIPSGVDLPAEVGAEADPPEVLYAGRLSPEKGLEELVAAARGLNLVVAGDGPAALTRPGRPRVRASRPARAALRAGGGRRVPFAPRRLRRGLPR